MSVEEGAYLVGIRFTPAVEAAHAPPGSIPKLPAVEGDIALPTPRVLDEKGSTPPSAGSSERHRVPDLIPQIPAYREIKIVRETRQVISVHEPLPPRPKARPSGHWAKGHLPYCRVGCGVAARASIPSSRVIAAASALALRGEEREPSVNTKFAPVRAT